MNNNNLKIDTPTKDPHSNTVYHRGLCVCVFAVFLRRLCIHFSFVRFSSLSNTRRRRRAARIKSETRRGIRKSNRKTSAQSIWNITCTGQQQPLQWSAVESETRTVTRWKLWTFSQIEKFRVCYSSVKIIDARDSTDSNREWCERRAHGKYKKKKRRKKKNKKFKRKKTRANTTQRKAQHSPAQRRRDKNWSELCVCVWFGGVNCVPH